MSFRILFYQEKGSFPVQEYIKALDEPQQNKIFAALKRLEEEGYNLRRPLADSLGSKTGLYELRPGRHRILYSFHERRCVVLLHVFLKKTDAIPQKDIELALVRKEMCEVWFKHGMIGTEEDQ